MDEFAEQLVKKYHSTKDDVKKAVIIVVAVAVTIISFVLVLIGFPLAVILPVCAIWVSVYLLKMMNVEYEYSCTNGSLDIDKILGQNQRKSMLTVEVRSFTAYGKVGTVKESDEDMTTFSAMGISLMDEDQKEETEEYYAEFEHPEHGRCCLYFSPDAKLRSALEPFLSHELKKQLKTKA